MNPDEQRQPAGRYEREERCVTPTARNPGMPLGVEVAGKAQGHQGRSPAADSKAT